MFFGRKWRLPDYPGNGWLYWDFWMFCIVVLWFFCLVDLVWEEGWGGGGDNQLSYKYANMCTHMCACKAHAIRHPVTHCPPTLRRGLLTEWEAWISAGLDCQWALAIHLSLPQCWGFKYVQLCPAFHMCPGNPSSGRHVWRASSVTNWAMSLAPRHIFFSSFLL